MANTVYQVNKGINRPLEFKGLQAQYIWYLGGGLAGVLVAYSALYISGINPYICVVIALCSGGFVFMKVYRMNNKYGQHGLARKSAQRKIPKAIRFRSRRCFKNM
jgi:hypothetical protein